MTSFFTDHNHEVSEDYYNRENCILSEKDEDLIKDLRMANAKPSRIADVLKGKNNAILTNKKIQNIIQRLIPKQNEDNQEKLAQFLETIEKDGGTFETKCDSDETVTAIYVQSNLMKKAFLASDPPVIQVDTSFSI